VHDVSLARIVLEAIETEFFFQPLMCLLADPACLDGGCQHAQVSLAGRRSALLLKALGITVIATDSPSSFLDDTPTEADAANPRRGFRV
jgi:hypothetical protein